MDTALWQAAMWGSIRQNSWAPRRLATLPVEPGRQMLVYVKYLCPEWKAEEEEVPWLLCHFQDPLKLSCQPPSPDLLPTSSEWTRTALCPTFHFLPRTQPLSHHVEFHRQRSHLFPCTSRTSWTFINNDDTDNLLSTQHYAKWLRIHIMDSNDPTLLWY